MKKTKTKRHQARKRTPAPVHRLKAARKMRRTARPPVAQAPALSPEKQRDKELGERFKDHRLNTRMLTQKEAAKEIGIATTSVRHAEQGKMGLLLRRTIIAWLEHPDPANFRTVVAN